ncbi:MAG: hypothetical protein FGM41_05600 [Bacteroidetes bacterium]|nr:hypothetical protein [Bacteroidota bacterium]
MLTLIPYFLTVNLICLIYGIIPFILLKRTLPLNPFAPILVGYAIVGVLSQWFMIGGAINTFAFLVLLLGAFVALWRYSYNYKPYKKNLNTWFQSLSKKEVIGFVIFGLLVAYQSSLPTKINDMGGYYLQTIQWMREYGIVKGLGNLHPALGLGSAWHSLVTLVSPLPPETLPFFAINGSLMLALALFIWIELKYHFSWYLFAYAVLVFPLGFLYLTAPSPDWPLLVFVPLLGYWAFIKRETLPTEVFLLLACFVFACKPSSAMLVFFLVVRFFYTKQQNNGSFFSALKKPFLRFFMLVFCVALALAPLIYKNHIQTGYPLYPSGLSIGTAPKWQIPKDWNQAYRQGIQSWGINDKVEVSTFKAPNPASGNRFKKWLLRSGYKGLMNKLIFLNALFALALLFTKRKLQERLLLLALIGISSLEWYFLSQYRLMLPTALCLFSFNILFTFNIQNSLFEIRHSSLFTLTSSLLLLLFALLSFFPFSILKDSSRNQQITQTDGFTSANLIVPYTNYRIGTLDTFLVDSIPFHYYKERAYAWNCPIPAVSASHRKFLKENFGYELRALGREVKDGFWLEH